MPGVRRPQRALDLDRRNRDLLARIGAEIRGMRERRGWTRTELASRAGLGRMVESRIERGIGHPDLDALQRIALALDRPLLVSFGGRDPSEPRRTPRISPSRSLSCGSGGLPVTRARSSWRRARPSRGAPLMWAWRRTLAAS